MTDLVEFKPGRGGVRPGAGRPMKQAGDPATAKQTSNERYSEERARHEKIKADQRALKLKIESNEYVPRAAVREASAFLLAALAQGMRAIPDNLERKFNLPGDVAEEIGRVIDASLADIAEGLEMFTLDERTQAS